MPARIWHYVWYACLFTGAFIILERVMGGLTGGLKKGASTALGL